MELKRVVITGLGALTPIGNNVNDLWNNLLEGVSGAGPITRFDASKFKTRFACELKGFDPAEHFDHKEARRMDPFCHYAMVAAEEAIQDSGLDLDKIDKDRAGAIWGSGQGGIHTIQEQVTEFAKGDGTPRFSPFFVVKMIVNISSGLISMKYGLRGINYSIVSACATSTNSLIDAFNYIRLGKADIIISGGSEAPINELGLGGFNAMKALSTRNESPETASRPFDADRDGFVLGEGAGALVLEEYEHATKRGARIYAECVGGGMSADAYHMSAPHPEGYGAYLGMKAALEDANLLPSDVDYINAHATSTPLGDAVELKAMEKVFGEGLRNINISATKSMTGHLLGVAGAVEAIICVKAIEQDVVPPTINTERLDPEINPDFNLTLGKKQKREVRVAMSNTFGFGGHNATIILKTL